MNRDELKNAVNIGPKLAAALMTVGIDDMTVLRERGAISAWESLRRAGEFDCLQSLLAITGALEGVRWHELPEKQRASLADHVERSAA